VIAFLRGTLHEKSPNRLVIDVNGVGYEVHVPLSTFYHVPSLGENVALRVHTHVREEAISLFGFGTDLEIRVFEKLVGISGIGPKLAVSVLSGIDAIELVRAVRTGDTARLTLIPGVGKKTAERISLELKDRLPLVLTEEQTVESESSEAHPLRSDLLSALLNLGYHRSLAERAIDSALDVRGGSSFEELLKQALHGLTR
jgi:Holliday junction DNA helicase RuvA